MNRDGWGAYLPVLEIRDAWVSGLGLERSGVDALPGASGDIGRGRRRTRARCYYMRCRREVIIGRRIWGSGEVHGDGDRGVLRAARRGEE